MAREPSVREICCGTVDPVIRIVILTAEGSRSGWRQHQERRGRCRT
jgi:hypothetical protein